MLQKIGSSCCLIPPWIECWSLRKSLRRNSMDIVYVDGDHSYEGVASDLNAWWPILRDGGAMVGHAAWFDQWV